MRRPLLRPGLLAGRAVAVAAAGPAELAAAVAARAEGLGARVARVTVDPTGDEPDATATGAVDQVVWDGTSAFGAGGEVAAVRAALDGAWLAVRSVAVAHFIPAGRGGRAVLLGPRPGDAHAAAARAGLENMARTLSIEWARYAIRPVAVLPGAATSAEVVAELCAFLASPAGDYHSGSVLELA